MLGLLQDDESIVEISEIIGQCFDKPKTPTTKNPNLVQVIEQPENKKNRPLIEKSINMCLKRREHLKNLESIPKYENMI